MNFTFVSTRKEEKTPLTILPVHLERLIAIGCNVVGSNSQSGFMAMHLAVQFNDIQAIKILLKHRVSVAVRTNSEKRETPICIAAARNHPQVIDILANAGADLNEGNSDGWSPLHVAIQRGAMDSCRKLLVLGTDPNSRDKHGMTPLHIVAVYDRVDMIKMLIFHGGDLSAIYDSMATEIRKRKALLKALLPGFYSGATPEYYYRTPLHAAVECEAQNAIHELINLGADIDARNTGRTPLHYATFSFGSSFLSSRDSSHPPCQ